MTPPTPFALNFPIMSRVILRPGRLLVIALGASLMLAPFSTLWALAPLCLWTLPASLYLERRWLDFLLLPPFTGAILFWALGTGLSLPLLSVVGRDEFLQGYTGAQLGYLLGWPFAAAGYALGALYRQSPLPGSPIQIAERCPALAAFAWGWVAVAVGLALFREPATPGSANLLGGFPLNPNFYSRVFPSLGFPAFFLVPLLWIRSGKCGKAMLITALTGYFLAVLPGGSRGDWLYPVLFLLLGAYFFRQDNSPLFERTYLWFAPLALLAIFIGLVIRGNLRQNVRPETGIIGRLSIALLAPFQSVQPYRQLVSPFLQSFLGNFDERIHVRTPAFIPYCGWEGLGAVRQVWLPQTLFPGKSSLLTDEAVYEQYCPPHQILWHRQRNEVIGQGAGLSLTGDAYRRFGWPGIPPVCFLVFLVFGALCRGLMRLGQRNSPAPWAFFAFCIGLLLTRPIGSLGVTLWQFLYNLPKHLICLLIFSAFFGWLFHRLIPRPGEKRGFQTLTHQSGKRRDATPRQESGQPSPLSFSGSFPVMSWWLDKTGWGLAGAVLLGGVLAGFGPVFGLAPFCLWSLWVVLRMERKAADYFLLPPLTSAFVLPALGTGLGLPLLQLAGATEESVFSFPLVQLGYLLAFPFALFGYWIGGFRKFQGFPEPPIRLAGRCPALLPGAWLWWAGGTSFFILRILLGWDGRGAGLPSLKPWPSFPLEPGILLGLFPSLVFPGFFFVPYLWKKSRRPGRSLLVLLAGLFLGFAGSTGARGDLIYPMLFVFAGAFFFREKDSAAWEKIFFTLFLGAFLFGFAGLVLRAVYRQSDAASTLPAARWSAAAGFLRQPDPAIVRNEIIPFCRSLHPWFDERIFHQTPKRRARLELRPEYQPPDVPHQGWQGWEATLYTYVPHLFLPQKPTLLDSEIIYRDYATPDERIWSEHRREPLGRGSILTPQADAFRRFGWWGIPPAILLVFVIYGALSRWMLSLGDGTRLWQWGLLVFSLSFFMARPMVTLLQTWWIYFYHIPKQLLVLWLFSLGVDQAVARTAPRRAHPTPPASRPPD